MNAPEPSAETGLGTHFGSTFAPRTDTPSSPTNSTLNSNNPFRDSSSPRHASPAKSGVNTHTRQVSAGGSHERFPDYRADAPQRSSGSATRSPPAYDEVTAGPSVGGSGPNRRRTSSLRERYPGDNSHKPLDVIRRDSRKAHRSPHLNKRQLPGADQIDRLDPALGGRAYHHEGPYDAALLARNMDSKTAPIAALETSNQEALKATPRENIKDALERHKPLDGVAQMPPGVPDQLGRTYEYEEGADMMREAGGDDPGYKRWAGKVCVEISSQHFQITHTAQDYDPEDLKGQSEPTFSLDRAFQAHKIDDRGIEMGDRAHIKQDYHNAQRKGTLDARDPVEIAGGDGKYVDAELANYARSHDNDATVKRTVSIRAAGDSLKKRIGSLRHRNHDE